MKTLGKVKLNQFSKEELDQRKMSVLLGGSDPRDPEEVCCNGCFCICHGEGDLHSFANSSVATLSNTAMLVSVFG